MPNRSPFQSLLDELETVLDDERVALRQLDRDGISLAAENKLRLDLALNAVQRPDAATAEQRQQVERIRRTAQVNQVLLVHARSCVQGMLQLMTGHNPSPVARSGSAAPPPVALNLRG